MDSRPETEFALARLARDLRKSERLHTLSEDELHAMTLGESAAYIAGYVTGWDAASNEGQE